MGTDPQQLFGAGLGLRLSRKGGRPQFVLEEQHPDGRRWVVLGRFLTEADADRALADLQAREDEDPPRRRVRKVRGS